jgi:peptidoglycan/LPS O-acetylase OafA/YrhL
MIKFPRYRLADLLERKGNNLDLVRLICSCMVIFGHSFLLTGDPAFPFGIWDPISRYLGYEGIYVASLAVKIFFFISGLLVTNSLLRRKSIPAFLIARFFRIWPALIALLLITVFVVGPLCSNLKPAEYFTERGTYAYLWQNLFMLTNPTLPGVFVSNPMSNQVNASIWTLPYEIAAYLGILLLYALRIINSRLICSAITVLLLVDPLLPHSLLFPWMTVNPQINYLPPCFALGAWMVLFKDKITISVPLVAMVTTIFLCVKSTVFGPYFFFLTTFVSVLYASALPFIQRIKLPADLSYGTFLWGFLIQQIMAANFASRGLPYNLGWSLALALLAGYLSWHLIEKKAIAAGHRYAKAWMATRK